LGHELVRCCFETFLKDKLSPQQKPRRRRLGCWCGGERRELSRQDHDQRNRDLRQRSLDLVKGKKNLEGIVMNTGDFWRRKGSIKVVILLVRKRRREQFRSPARF
jgi:hypothetical protein